MNDETGDSHTSLDIPSECKKNKGKSRNNVLYHLIDGYVIEEADTPFALDTGSLLTKQQLQDIYRKQQELMAKEQELEKSNNSTNRKSSESRPPKDDVVRRCEDCGKMGKDHWSARFCSVTCCRRTNIARARAVRLNVSQKKVEENHDSSKLKRRYFDSPPVSPVRPHVPVVEGRDGSVVPLSPSKWSVDHVCEFIESLPDAKSFSKDFRANEIDGSALVLIKEDHLIHTLNIKLGPALKLCSHIRKLAEQ